MKLYDGIGPNPRMVRLFLHEKSVTIPAVQVDILAGENRRAPHTEREPDGAAADAGARRAALHRRGHGDLRVHRGHASGTAADRHLAGGEGGDAHVDAPRRPEHLRADGNAFRYGEGLAIFQDRIRCIPEASAGLKQIAQDNLAKVDAPCRCGTYLCGDRFTMADILLYAFLDFAHGVGQPLDPGKRNLHGVVRARRRATLGAASLNPAAVNAGLRG